MVNSIIPFLMFGKVTVINILMSWKGIVKVLSHTHLQNTNDSLSKNKAAYGCNFAQC